MSQKILALGKITGHDQIGIQVGAGHVRMADLLQKEPQLKPEVRSKIAARDPDALKMYRCIYDKQAERWRVEEHSL